MFPVGPSIIFLHFWHQVIKCDDGIKSECYLFVMCVFLHDAEFKLDLTIGLARALWHNLLTRLLN